MQDVQQINDGVVGGRLSMLRRLNDHPQQLQEQGVNVTHHLQQQPQLVALKCPRCDSLNTKFCYYNNYNLSQPRHFCKNCRRYWTKGGVLRNVPFGGGCRKSKRSSSSSKHKSSSSANDSYSLSSRKIAQSSTHSSSESSSTPPAVSGGALLQIPEVENDFGLSSGLENNSSSNNNNTNNNNLFSEGIGGFMSLITHKCSNNSENENSTSVSVAETASFTEFLQNQQELQEDWDMGKICGVHRQEEDKIGGSNDLVEDPTVRIEDLWHNRGSNVGFTTLDWHLTCGNNASQGLHYVPDSSTVDQAGYWSLSTTAAHHIDSQWSNSATTHLPLFLP